MSRIGKLPIAIPAGVEVKVEGNLLTAKGPKGTETVEFPSEIEVVINEKEVVVNRKAEDRKSRSLHGLFRTLISNAIKFTPNGGKIDIALKRKDKNVEIKVIDTGLGMTRETGVRIFEKFYQGDTSHSTQGNGLGLALVKKVIDILGGEITVQSELNKGSTFTILLKDVVYED